MDALKQKKNKNKNMFFTTFSRSVYWGSVMGWGGVVEGGEVGGLHIQEKSQPPPFL